ncbi:MAG: P22 phage major capsid protein family protein [Parvibaculaceae bacterium]|nr:P22 phage major capsid protein family protein [Parvibaculaceae bacterium]
MAENTLTDLIPSLYAGLNQVSREMVGFLPAASRHADADRAAVGQSVTVPIAPAANGSDITPSMTTPEPTGQTVSNAQVTITKARAYEFGFVGEAALGLNNNGAGYNTVQANMFAEALRGIVNEMESDIALAAYKAASRATGTAATVPFASSAGITAAAQARKILNDNGAPMVDRSLVLNSSAAANVAANTNLTYVNQAGDDKTLRDGVLGRLSGFNLRESGADLNHTKGTGSGYLVNSAGLALGDTTIPADDGSGTILAGDVVTFAGDSNKYVVASALSGGSFTIAKPGLLAVPDNDAEITVGASYEGSVAFSRNALLLAVRSPALEGGGDAATDRTTIEDLVSGLSFEVSRYAGYRKTRYEVAAAWGQAVIKPEHVGLLLG